MEHFLEVREGDVEGRALAEGVRRALDVAHDIYKTVVAPGGHGGDAHFHPVGVLVVGRMSASLAHESHRLGIRKQGVGVRCQWPKLRPPVTSLVHILLYLVAMSVK